MIIVKEDAKETSMSATTTLHDGKRTIILDAIPEFAPVDYWEEKQEQWKEHVESGKFKLMDARFDENNMLIEDIVLNTVLSVPFMGQVVTRPRPEVQHEDIKLNLKNYPDAFNNHYLAQEEFFAAFDNVDDAEYDPDSDDMEKLIPLFDALIEYSFDLFNDLVFESGSPEMMLLSREVINTIKSNNDDLYVVLNTPADVKTILALEKMGYKVTDISFVQPNDYIECDD